MTPQKCCLTYTTDGQSNLLSWFRVWWSFYFVRFVWEYMKFLIMWYYIQKYYIICIYFWNKIIWLIIQMKRVVLRIISKLPPKYCDPRISDWLLTHTILITIKSTYLSTSKWWWNIGNKNLNYILSYAYRYDMALYR